MVVTRVEAVTKTKYKVYVDGQFAFILYKGELSRFHIAEDQELSQESYEKIRTEVILKRAKLRAMHLLNDMWRTEVQLREKLTRNEYPADIVEAAISYVKSFGDEEIRTLDPLLARQVLSQLSYAPLRVIMLLLVLALTFSVSFGFSPYGLKWTRTTDLTLIRRAL